jgi:hypothetical protein
LAWVLLSTLHLTKMGNCIPTQQQNLGLWIRRHPAELRSLNAIHVTFTNEDLLADVFQRVNAEYGWNYSRIYQSDNEGNLDPTQELCPDRSAADDRPLWFEAVDDKILALLGGIITGRFNGKGKQNNAGGGINT